MVAALPSDSHRRGRRRPTTDDFDVNKGAMDGRPAPTMATAEKNKCPPFVTGKLSPAKD